MKKYILSLFAFFTFTLAFAQDFTTDSRFIFAEFSFGEHDISTSSSIYDFNQENLLFNPSSLDGMDFSLGLYSQRNNHLAFGVKLDHYNESVVTEDRFYEYEDGSPILQSISLEKSYIGMEMILTPFGAGERFGSHAWAPKTFVPYLRLGAGILDWDYSENGDFVDYSDLTIFYDTYYSTGSTLGLQLGAGFRVKISPRMDAHFDYTYTHAEDSLNGSDFIGFGDLDLSSTSARVGITIKFF